MLQDLTYGILDNQYKNLSPEVGDVALCFRDGQVLLHRDANDRLTLTRFSSPAPGRYLFSLQENRYFLYSDDTADWESDFSWEPVRQLRQLQSKDICFAIMTGWHLYNWYESNRFCGKCGTVTVHDNLQRMLSCPHCKNMIFPRINPAVIIAVTDGDRLLLSKYAGRAYTRYALLAGFTEIGETPEQTVAREVMEEVGLKVKNIRYYKSQPWGVDGNLLLGFFCDLDGDSTIHLDETELSMAAFYPRDALPAKDDGISLTREMIRVFEEGREPK
ncbi:MAG: NAD(+) diphosphatase [Ruminococcaceae bacterium]|nr:NAD(+) diphosphatase [Oscillospiraceae bacterium]